jgi:hypothetical protein
MTKHFIFYRSPRETRQEILQGNWGLWPDGRLAGRMIIIIINQ